MDGSWLLLTTAGLTSSGDFSVLLQKAHTDVFVVHFSPQGSVIGKRSFLYKPLNVHTSFLSPDLEIFRQQDSLLISAGHGSIKRVLALPAGFNSLSIINDTLFVINTGNGAVFTI
jgi:hypothetical protein